MIEIMTAYFLFAICGTSWCQNVVITNQSNGLQNVLCTVAFQGTPTLPANYPWAFPFLFFAIYASSLIAVLAYRRNFASFATVSFFMSFVAIPFIQYGCTYGTQPIIPLMPVSYVFIPIVLFILSAIASIFFDK